MLNCFVNDPNSVWERGREKTKPNPYAINNPTLFLIFRFTFRHRLPGKDLPIFVVLVER